MLVFPSSPNTGDVFAPGPGFPSWMWDGDKWTRAGPGVAVSLEQLSDVSLTDPRPGQMLTWDGEKWVNMASTAALGALTDVALVPPVSDGEMLVWNDTNLRWENQPQPEPPPVPSLATLTDVALDSPGAGELLTFDGARWGNGGPAVINSGGGIGLTINTSAGSWEQIEVKNLATAGGAFARFTDSVGNSTTFGTHGAGFGVIRTADTDRITISQTGAVIVNAADNTTLTVMAKSGYTALAVQGAPNAMFVAGEVTVLSAPQTDYWFKLNATGGGFIASERGNFNWDNDGKFGINGIPPYSPWHVGLTVYSVSDWRAWAVNCIAAQPRGNCLNLQSSGDASDYAINLSVPSVGVGFSGQGFRVDGRGTVGCLNALNVTGSDDGSYACVITAAQTSTPGRGYGLAVRATNITGATPFCVWNAPWTQQLFQVDINGTAYAWGWSTWSSARHKTDVRAVTRERARATLAGLRAVSFRWKEREREGTHYGLIAEEVAQIDSNLVTYDEQHRPQSVRYDEALLMLLPLMRELLGMEEPTDAHVSI